MVEQGEHVVQAPAVVDEALREHLYQITVAGDPRFLATHGAWLDSSSDPAHPLICVFSQFGTFSKGWAEYLEKHLHPGCVVSPSWREDTGCVDLDGVTWWKHRIPLNPKLILFPPKTRDQKLVFHFG